MRLAPLIVSAVLLTGCGAAIAEEQPASETDTARIVVKWDGDPTEGVYDLANGTGVADGTILTGDAIYVPIEIQPTGARGKRWLKSPPEASDPFLLAPLVDRPQELLALIETAEKGEAVGEGEERGDPVTYFAATLRLDAFLATLTPAERADVSDYYADWEGLAFQLAIDEHDRFRKAEFGFWNEELVIELFDYGVPVDARAPDPSTVLTWQEYAKLLETECEQAKKEGRESEVPHCVSCGAGEGESDGEA
jgi:hypothetical protein